MLAHTRTVSCIALALFALCSFTVAGCVVRSPDDGDDDHRRDYSADAGTSGGSSESGGAGGLGGIGGGSDDSEDAGSFGDTGGTTTGSKSCRWLIDCTADCPADDDTCIENCLEQGTREAQETFRRATVCFSENDCDGAECACRNCKTEFQQCEPRSCTGGGSDSDGDSTSNNSCAANNSMSCSELIDCVVCCESESCVQDTCAANSTQTAIERYKALNECSERNNCPSASDTEQCLSENCSSELRACAN